MQKQNSRIGTIILSIVLTAVLVGGGVFLLQQNSIKELRNEIQNIQNTTSEKSPASEEVVTSENTKIDMNSKATTENVEAEEKTTPLPDGVEWLTYSDNDLSFVYPKTFLGTPMQEDSDQNMGRNEWKVTREDNVIYIRPNFESPAAEFGSTYEITIIDSPEEAGALNREIAYSTTPKNFCINLDNIQVQEGYEACAYEQEVDEEMGKTGKYYIVSPISANGSLTTSIYVFDASGGMYSNYVSSTLLSSLKIK
ncbi:hypothetical protein GF376_04010 [Candidatus Peregrinibacteria bacterium]|nr:hypothetical protein [Candidatus Peregrinibacteria bacterium]